MRHMLRRIHFNVRRQLRTGLQSNVQVLRNQQGILDIGLFTGKRRGQLVLDGFIPSEKSGWTSNIFSKRGLLDETTLAQFIENFKICGGVNRLAQRHRLWTAEGQTIGVKVRSRIQI